MMHVKETSRIRFTSFVLSAAMIVASGFAMGVVAQETQPQKPVVTTKRNLGGGAIRSGSMSHLVPW